MDSYSSWIYTHYAIKKNEEGHYVVEKSYFTEARKENHYLDYIKNYTPLEGLDLGTCEEEGVKAYYWYREKLAAYHNAYAKDFLDSTTIIYTVEGGEGTINNEFVVDASTTLPAATMEFSPMVMPASTLTSAPSHALRPTTMGFVRREWRVTGSSG